MQFRELVHEGSCLNKVNILGMGRLGNQSRKLIS